MKIHIRRTPRRNLRSRYPLRPTSFLTSVAVHVCFIAIVLFVRMGGPAAPLRPIYETEIKPNEKKIVWYSFHDKIPNLPATRRIGTAEDPQGKLVSPQVILATSKNAENSKQFIWQPTPEEIKQEVKAPNVVAVKAPSAAPSPPAKPEPAKEKEGLAAVKQEPRQFHPPPQPVKARIVIPVMIADAPPDATPLGGSVPLPDQSSTAFGQTKIPPKRYVPPKAQHQAGSGEETAKVVTVAAPELSGPANVNMAIVGLNPSNLPPPTIPAGSLPGQFSTASKAGAASSGNLPVNSAGIPNLVVEGKGPARSGAAEAAIPSPKRTVLYRQVASAPMPSTLSAPLRPGTRTIPAALETRFQGVNVYTMVLPAPTLPGYAGDWVLWFADRQDGSQGTAQMRAPVPYRKRISDQQNTASGTPVIRVQVAGFVGKDGRFDRLTILKGGGPGVANAVLDDMKSWEFSPATRNAVPVDVEVVIEIPFRLETRAER